MRFLNFLSFTLLILLSGCQQKEPSAPAQAAPSAPAELPGVPSDILNRLMDECTGIDYIFNELPFSLSFQEEPGIDQNIAFIDPAIRVGPIPADCKPMARKLFLIKGEIAYEADVYYSGKCKFYVFLGKDKKPLYANGISAAGVQYYLQVFQQAQGMGQQAQ